MKRGHGKGSGKSIDELVDQWTRGAGSDLELASLRDLIQFLGDELYSQYEPFIHKRPFWERLSAWVGNVPRKSEQQALFRLVPWLLFVGKSELNTMYESAFRGPITRWLIDTAGLDFSAPSLTDQLADEVRHTWFGSLAGMDLGSFMRINGIEEQSLRPDFRVLSKLGAPERIAEYVSNGTESVEKRYRRIVVVEDFVGTGAQMKGATKCLSHLSGVPIFICPMIAAEEGCTAGRELTKTHPHIEFQEYYRISSSARLRPSDPDYELDDELMAVCDVIDSTWERLNRPEPYDKPYGFGNMGILLLTYLNCPNNVPPIVHRDVNDSGSKGQWIPLFPRAIREV
ncbi:MAG: phosphoribosyltransferase [Planctomycetota bacterium]